MIDLDKILQETAEFAKKRDAATPGEWKINKDHWLQLINDNDSVILSDFVSGGGSGCPESMRDWDFIAAAKNFDSPSIIKQLVSKVKDFQNALDDRDQVINRLQDVVDFYECTVCVDVSELKQALQGRISEETLTIKPIDPIKIGQIVSRVKELEAGIEVALRALNKLHGASMNSASIAWPAMQVLEKIMGIES